MNRRTVCLLLCILSVWAVASSAAAPHPREPAVGISESSSGTNSEKTAILGMIAYSDPKAQFKAIAPLADYLGQAAHLQVNLKLYPDYFSLLNDIDHESLDLAVVSPIVFAFCMDDPTLTYLATSLEAGRPFYHAAILARKDSNILSVKSLSEKKIAFVDPYSASGYVYPAAFLLESGLVPNGKPSYIPVFSGSHEKVLRALLEGKVDAAATYENFFAFAGHKIAGRENLSIGDFRVLRLLPEQIPNDAVVCRAALGTSTIQLLERALKGYEAERALIDSPLKGVFYTGFKPGQHAAYGAVRTYLEKLSGSVLPPADDNRPQDAK